MNNQKADSLVRWTKIKSCDAHTCSQPGSLAASATQSIAADLRRLKLGGGMSVRRGGVGW